MASFFHFLRTWPRIPLEPGGHSLSFVDLCGEPMNVAESAQRGIRRNVAAVASGSTMGRT
jgi:hypothetical protein